MNPRRVIQLMKTLEKVFEANIGNDQKIHHPNRANHFDDPVGNGQGGFLIHFARAQAVHGRSGPPAGVLGHRGVSK